MIRTTSILGATCLLVCNVALAAPSPGETDVARKIFRDGSVAEDAGRWQEAMADFQKVIDVKPTSSALLHLAGCQEQLGQLVEALLDYDRALELLEHEGAPRRIVATARAKREALARRVPTLKLDVAKDVTDPELTIDGQHVSASVLDNAIPMNPGEHSISVSAPSRRLYAKQITLTEQLALVETVDLPLAVETRAGAMLLSEKPSDAAQSEKRERSLRTVIVVGEAAVAVAGAALLIGSRLQVSAAEERIASHQAELPATNACTVPKNADACADLASAFDDKRAANARTVVGTGMIIAGGAAFAATWLLWSTEGVQTHIVERVAVSPRGAIFLSGTF